MKRGRTTIAGALIAAAVVSATLVVPNQRAAAAPPGDDSVIAFEVRGVGNGHGRGMSQWGAFGRALAGQTWQEIVGAYYGGTSPAIRNEAALRVRLTDWDGRNSLGVVSAGGTARWAGGATGYASIFATEIAPNTFTIHGSTSDRSCAPTLTLNVPTSDLTIGAPVNDDVRDLQRLMNHFGFDAGPVDGDFGPMTEAAVERFQQDENLVDDGRWRAAERSAAQTRLDNEDPVDWQELASNVAGPIRFTTSVDESSAGSGEVLGACRPSGGITHYRGAIELRHTGDGNRVINELDVENYLRGVLPKEVSPSWGDAGGGDGMQALRAQSVAARSYGLSQSRYSYASTCDTSSCQVYGGAARRVSASTNSVSSVEHPNTDAAIVTTDGTVRVWSDGSIVSTEFSASNGPTTAGGAFPAVDDSAYDDQPGNPYHRWTRIIDADRIIDRYGLATANGVRTVVDGDSPYAGMWANEVALGNGSSVSAWSFRNTFGLRSPGFELIPIRRTVTAAADFHLIGDSVGVGIAGTTASELPVVTEGMFGEVELDVLTNRRTQGGTVEDGVAAAARIPKGTELVVVELGYNDDPATMPDRIDTMMTALQDRGVGLVLWVDLSTRRSSAGYGATNAALRDATERWSGLGVLNWDVASTGPGADRWFADDVHLTPTGDAEFAIWLREQILEVIADGYTPPRPVVPGQPLRVPVMGVGGVPAGGAGVDVLGVALNVTAVGPVGAGFLRVWPCGSAEPETSSVNYVAGGIEPNAVVVPVDSTGEVCVSSMVETDVVVDVSGWFDAGVRSGVGRLVDTREGSRLAGGSVLRVPVMGVGGVPAGGAGVDVLGVALNVTAVGPVGAGFLRVWPCGSAEPETSSVNYVAGGIEPNAVVVPVDSTGEVCVSSMVETDVVVDVSGWFDAGVRSGVGRLVDTREGSRLAGGSVLRVPVMGVGGVPAGGAGVDVLGVALNVTAVGPVGAGFLRVWPCGSAEPETSSVNYVAGGIEPNAVVVPVDSTGEVCVSSMVETDVVVDVSGWFDAGLRASPGARAADTRYGIGPPAPR